MKEKAKMMNYCKNKDLGADKILNEKSAVLFPLFAIWAVENRKEHEKYWVVTGDLLHDHILFEIADTARDALRHFTMNWQLKAEKIEQRLTQKEAITGNSDELKSSVDVLRGQAEKYYEFTTRPELW